MEDQQVGRLLSLFPYTEPLTRGGNEGDGTEAMLTSNVEGPPSRSSSAGLDSTQGLRQALHTPVHTGPGPAVKAGAVTPVTSEKAAVHSLCSCGCSGSALADGARARAGLPEGPLHSAPGLRTLEKAGDTQMTAATWCIPLRA